MSDIHTETLFSPIVSKTPSQPVFLFNKPLTNDPLSEHREPLPLLISTLNRLPEIIVHFGRYYTQDSFIRNHYYEAYSVYVSTLADTIP